MSTRSPFGLRRGRRGQKCPSAARKSKVCKPFVEPLEPRLAPSTDLGLGEAWPWQPDETSYSMSLGAGSTAVAAPLPFDATPELLSLDDANRPPETVVDGYWKPIGSPTEIGWVEQRYGSVYQPVIAPDGAGSFVILWYSSDGTGSTLHSIQMRRIDGAGRALSETVTLVDRGANVDKDGPAIGFDGSGGFVLAWNNRGVWVQRFGLDGTPDGEAQRVTPEALTTWEADLAVLPDGRFVVSWIQVFYEGRLGTLQLYAQRFGADGQKSGSPILAAEAPYEWETNAALALAADGGFAIALAAPSGVTAYRFDADGNALGSPIIISQAPANNAMWTYGKVAIEFLRDGEFVVAYTAGEKRFGFIQPAVIGWVDPRANNSGNRIFAQRFSSDGVAQGDEIVVGSNWGMDHEDPVVRATDDGGFTVLWRQQKSYDRQLLRRAFDAEGQPVGETASLGPGIYQGYHDYAADTPDGGVLVVGIESTHMCVLAERLESIPAGVIRGRIDGLPNPGWPWPRMYRTFENGDVYLDLNRNGQQDAEEPYAVVDSLGFYLFTGLAPGRYIVRASDLIRSISFGATSQEVEVTAGATAVVASFAVWYYDPQPPIAPPPPAPELPPAEGIGFDPQIVPTPYRMNPDDVFVGDFDGDGIPDLAAATGTEFSDVLIFRGNGDGTFSFVQRLLTRAFSSSVIAGDFNGDGALDLVISGYGYGEYWDVSVFLNNRDGTFAPGKSLVTWPRYHGQPRFVLDTLTIGDFNADGKLDLAVIVNQGFYFAPHVQVFVGNGAGEFSAGPANALPIGVNQMYAVDLNNDSALDLVGWSRGFGGVVNLLNDGTGAFSEVVVSTLPKLLGVLGFADFNGDGLLDVLARHSWEERLSVLLGDGTGSFTQSLDWYSGSGHLVDVAITDVDGDGMLDLAATRYDGESQYSLVVMLGNGEGGVTSSASFTLTGYLIVQFSPVFADLDGDGDRDGVLSTGSGHLLVMLNVGGAETAPEGTTVPDPSEPVTARSDSNLSSALIEATLAEGVRSAAGYFGAGPVLATTVVVEPATVNVQSDEPDDVTDSAFAEDRRRFIGSTSEIGPGELEDDPAGEQPTEQAEPTTEAIDRVFELFDALFGDGVSDGPLAGWFGLR